MFNTELLVDGVRQVNMLPSTMPPMVLVVATPKQARELQRRNDGQNGGQRVMWLHARQSHNQPCILLQTV